MAWGSPQWAFFLGRGGDCRVGGGLDHGHIAPEEADAGLTDSAGDGGGMDHAAVEDGAGRRLDVADAAVAQHVEGAIGDVIVRGFGGVRGTGLVPLLVSLLVSLEDEREHSEKSEKRGRTVRR